ncbi:MAG: DUF881 domain-containing protein [Armatimonadota bacterium]|nr:DUF881 domain-containing protein [Armatimonadota bacterium]
MAIVSNQVAGNAMRAWQIPLAVILVITGFLAVSQWRAGRPLRAQAELPTQRVEQLAALLKQQDEARRALEAEIRRLRERVASYQRAVGEGRGAAETMAQEVAQLRLVLGMTPVEGPGVVVRLRRGGVLGGILPVQTRATDLAGLVNELWSAGAEAVAVNGVRVLATTGFRDGDDAVVVGERMVRPPFVIAAIGEPLTLQTALNLRGGFVEGLRSIGLRVTVERRDRLRLPAHQGGLRYRYARPTTTR